MGKATTVDCWLCDENFIAEVGYTPNFGSPFRSCICPDCSEKLNKETKKDIDEQRHRDTQ